MHFLRTGGDEPRMNEDAPALVPYAGRGPISEDDMTETLYGVDSRSGRGVSRAARRRGFRAAERLGRRSARLLEQVGFPALATTSAGIAWSRRPAGRLARRRHDGRAGRRGSSRRRARPVSADLEAGYGASPEDVARVPSPSWRPRCGRGQPRGPAGWRAVRDRRSRRQGSRRRAPRRQRERSCSTPAPTPTSPEEPGTRSPRRSSARTRYVEAGADCIFVPGVDDADTIQRLAARSPRRSTSSPA